MGEFASKGVAGTALGLGIAGTVGLVNQLGGGCGNGGLLGGLFGNSCGNNQAQALMAENAQLKAEKYADSVAAQVYKANRDEKDALGERLLEKYIEPISKEIADMRVREARTEERLHCMGKEFRAAIELESERRSAGDQNLYCYVNATFVPGRLVMPKSAICPEVMPRWNSYTTPTNTAPDVQSNVVSVTNPE